MKKELIKEFCDRFNLTEQQWNTFLKEYEDNIPLKELSEKYNVNYNALRYLFYSLGFVNNSKASRIESVMLLQKELARENGQDYVIADEMEKELETVLNKNRQLVRSLTHARDENNSLRKMMRISDREIGGFTEIVDTIKQTLLTAPLPNLPFNLIDRGDLIKEKGQPFVLLSDLHYNEVTKGEYIENYNEFNNEICLQGIDKVLSEVQKYGGDTLRIYLGGDLLSGILHGLDKKGQVPVTQSVVELGRFLADRINKLSLQYESVKVIQISGNHERLYGNPVLDLKGFDFAHLMYEIMVSSISAKNVDSYYSKSTFALDNIGTDDKPKYAVLFHGDNKSFNPTSESSVLKQFNIFDELFGVRVVSTLSGHTHKPVFSPNCRGGSCIVNGCLSGSNEYGFNANFLPLQPYQWIGTWNVNGWADDLKCVRIR